MFTFAYQNKDQTYHCYKSMNDNGARLTSEKIALQVEFHNK